MHTCSSTRAYTLSFWILCAKKHVVCKETKKKNCAKKQKLFCRFGHGCFLHALEGVYQVCLTCENGLTLFLLGDVKQKYLKRNEKCSCVRAVLRFFRFNCRTWLEWAVYGFALSCTFEPWLQPLLFWPLIYISHHFSAVSFQIYCVFSSESDCHLCFDELIWFTLIWSHLNANDPPKLVWFQPHPNFAAGWIYWWDCSCVDWYC